MRPCTPGLRKPPRLPIALFDLLATIGCACATRPDSLRHFRRPLGVREPNTIRISLSTLASCPRTDDEILIALEWIPFHQQVIGPFHAEAQIGFVRELVLALDVQAKANDFGIVLGSVGDVL